MQEGPDGLERLRPRQLDRVLAVVVVLLVAADRTDSGVGHDQALQSGGASVGITVVVMSRLSAPY